MMIVVAWAAMRCSEIFRSEGLCGRIVGIQIVPWGIAICYGPNNSCNMRRSQKRFTVTPPNDTDREMELPARWKWEEGGFRCTTNQVQDGGQKLYFFHLFFWLGALHFINDISGWSSSIGSCFTPITVLNKTAFVMLASYAVEAFLGVQNIHI